MPVSSTDGLAAGEDRDVLEHRLAAIAEAGSLHGRAVQGAAELVAGQRRQSLTFGSQDRQHEILVGVIHRSLVVPAQTFRDAQDVIT